MEDYFEYPNVVGFGRGLRTIGGVLQSDPVTVVLVQEKLSVMMLGRDNLLPPDVDVLEVGVIRALSIHRQRVRPAPGGVSIGHFNITAGTLGTRVFDGPIRLILSNNHVLAMSNDASKGDAIYQPGPIDGGTAADLIAQLERFVPINFGDGGGGSGLADALASIGNVILGIFGISCQLIADCSDGGVINLVDAALALPLDDADLSDDILGIGPVQGTMPARLGMEVRKFGRTTALTQGVVQVIDAVVNVSYGDGKSATFDQQIITSAMSQGGDSGSLLVHGSENKAVGLLFAGSDQATIHNSIGNVLAELQVTI